MNIEAFQDFQFKVRFGVRGEDGVFHEIAPPPPAKMERCLFCEADFDVNNLHPVHERIFGKHPRVCRRCGLCFPQYGNIWSKDLEDKIVEAKTRAGLPRKCFMCCDNFNLLGSFYEHMWYRDVPVTELQNRTKSPEWRYWVHADGIDFLYPNLYTDICPKCFQRLFSQHIEAEYSDQLTAVRALGEKIGKLPVKEFPPYIYYFHNKDDIEWFLLLLSKLPDTDLINARFGSYFQLLIKCGLLPEGSRRMRIGTWVRAKDGDLCFSLVEREIDNWFYKNGIIHAKEVKYPESNMRCDWEILKNGKRYFVEYLGLMNIKAYEEKTVLKKQLAESNGIIFVGIMPRCDWESLLASIFLSS